jgi:hypothetical protein
MPDRDSRQLNQSAPWFLIVAHPGHELRVHHLLERVKPTVAVITDGSGSTAVPRVDETRTLLESVGASPAAILGELTDREAYHALMTTDATPFAALIDRLVSSLLARSARHAEGTAPGAPSHLHVLIDAAEGYNPLHDVCHWMGRRVVEQARAAGLTIDLFELDLVAHPDGTGNGLKLVLDDEAFDRKLAAAHRYSALAAEAAAAYNQYGQNAFRTEFVRRVHDRPLPPSSWVPYYEQVGEERVRAGRYTSVLRYGAHVRPVIETILQSTALGELDANAVSTADE